MSGLTPTLQVQYLLWIIPENWVSLILIVSLRIMESDFPMVLTLEHLAFLGSILGARSLLEEALNRMERACCNLIQA